MDVGGFALVTGAASGIGKACAKAFIKEGAAGVALVDINETALQTARAEIENLIVNMETRAEASGSKGMPRRQPLVAVCPGSTDTSLLKKNAHLHEMVAGLTAAIPMGRLARAEEIADGVLFLAGGRSSYVTGTTLMLDGGYTAK
ncbi:hypothetical protein E4U49_006783 [Claviceps purpurea]|nr:hypothetical protein E4U49_006783 [Claviceps purpurea]